MIVPMGADSKIEWTTHTFNAGLVRVGKKRAGRQLDGRPWDEFPALRAARQNGGAG